MWIVSLSTYLFVSVPGYENAMSKHQTVGKTDKLPRGIILLAVLLWIGAFFTAGIMLVPTATLQQFNLPRSLLLVGALALSMLGYGLIRLRRWAWIATLLFIFINGYTLVLFALEGTVQFAGLGLLIVAAVYLLWPSTRARFLGAARN
jgi:hypothetical protein